MRISDWSSDVCSSDLDEALIAGLDANAARLRQLADPRRIDMDDARADALITQSTPVYYITGALHSTETGSPTALMELGYRLAVDEAPYIRQIRAGVITLITPVVEVDGRDRKVDGYNWPLANTGQTCPSLPYWRQSCRTLTNSHENDLIFKHHPPL